MLRFFIRLLIIGGVLVGLGFLVWPPISRALAERNKPRWRTAKVEKGDITSVVNATGTVKPTKSVQIGSFVSGPIKELFVQFNQEVKAHDLLATIDPRLFAAIVAQEKAVLATRNADLQRVEALLQQARNDEARANKLKERNADFIAQAELDQVKFNRMSLEAQLVTAKALIEQATASLTQSQANLDYTEIRSPEDGMIIDRKVEPGQTLAAQFTTPELFVVGVGMREKMHVFADVDESEIGLIRQAQIDGQPVNFTVSAYPNDLFEGRIEEVRFSSVENQNVVTYPVVVGAPNPDLKLLPGMTANLSFQVNQQKDAIKVPKAALRFYPPDPKQVHPDDRKILEGVVEELPEATGDTDTPSLQPPAGDRVEANVKSAKRHVWKVDGEFLRAIEVEVGISDNRFSALVSGNLTVDTELVTGLKIPGEE
jgi:HlyD family secretion protein